MPELTPWAVGEASPDTMGAHYAEWCEGVGLPLAPNGYGLLMCHGPGQSRVTAIGRDVDYHRMLVDAPQGPLTDMLVPPDKYPEIREGWPEDWGWPVITPS